jgi:predicted HicB family RNase H-like nuclease
MYYKDDAENRPAKRSRITIDVTPELRRRIKLAAAQNDLSISEYLGRILEETVPDDEDETQQDWQPLSPDILEEVDRLHARVVRESGGHIFEDSAEVLRQQREERARYLEQLREQQ